MAKKNDVSDSTDILFQEINEEIKNEKIMAFWKKYGLYALILVVVALTIAVSYESIVAWKNKKAQTWSDAYAYAFNLQIQGNYDKSIAVFQDMADKNDGIYRDFSLLQIANIYLEQDKVNEAMTTLQKIIDNDDANPNLKNVALIKLVSYKLENAPAEEINKLLEPIINANNVWTNVALELKAMLAIRENDLATAKDLYSQILNSGANLQESMKTRAQDMLAVLSEAASHN